MVTVEATDVRAMWNERDRADYAAHGDDFPLLSICDDAHLAFALAKIDTLVDNDELSTGSGAYLDALMDLVGVYEDKTVRIPRASGVEVLRHLMEEREMHQKDLLGVFGSKSITSEILSGKRRFTMDHVARLGEFFGVPAGAFIDPPQAPKMSKKHCQVKLSRRKRQ